MYNGFSIRTYEGTTDVQYNFNIYFDMLLNKVCSLFKWENLPDSIDERYLNMGLMLNGKVCFTEFNGKLYALTGNWGGEPNAYYEPTIFTLANPVLGSKQVRVKRKDGVHSLEGLDGIIVANSDVDAESDRTIGGLYGLIYQTAGLLADNISSLNVAQINSRASLLFTADSEAQANSGEKVLRDIYNGKPYKILSQNIVEKFGINPVANSGGSQNLMTLMEIHQYILAQFYNEIGINSSFNMKRERLNTAEVEQSTGCLDVNIWNMLKNRQEGIEKVNELFGTNISVSLNEDVFYQESGNATMGEENAMEEDTNENGEEDVRDDSGEDSGSNSVDVVKEDSIKTETQEEIKTEMVASAAQQSERTLNSNPNESEAPAQELNAEATTELEIMAETVQDTVETISELVETLVEVIDEQEVETNEE